jgi:hypothetical protein
MTAGSGRQLRLWHRVLGLRVQTHGLRCYISFRPHPESVVGGVSLIHPCHFCSLCRCLLLSLAAPVGCPVAAFSTPALLLQPLLGRTCWPLSQQDAASAVSSLYHGNCLLLLSCRAKAPTRPPTVSATCSATFPSSFRRVSSSAALLMKRIRSREGRPLLRSLYWACCYNTREQHRMVSSGWSQSELSSLHAQAKESNKEVSTLITAHP